MGSRLDDQACPTQEFYKFCVKISVFINFKNYTNLTLSNILPKSKVHRIVVSFVQGRGGGYWSVNIRVSPRPVRARRDDIQPQCIRRVVTECVTPH